MSKEGNLRVYWIPQVPMNPFYVKVRSSEEAQKIMEVLSDYDEFQYENNVKPDYCNAGGLEVFEEGEWVDWVNEDGCDINEIMDIEND